MRNAKMDKRIVTVGPKYQVVIPREVRRACRGVRVGAKVYVYPLSESTMAVTVADENWAETHRGGLKDLWEGIDVAKQLREMRDEWDE